MIALSIRQPWAWLITRPDLTTEVTRRQALAKGHMKAVENRSWLTPYRGQFLIHAGQKCTVPDYDAALLFIEAFIDPELVQLVPPIEELPKGGVVGVAKLVDCVTEHRSPWFTGGKEQGGGYGFALQNAMPVPFMAWKGRQGFFDVVVKAKTGGAA